MLACRAGWFSFRYDYDLGCRVIVVWIGRPVVIAIPWPHAENLTMAEKMMPGEMTKMMRREMASRVRRVHADSMNSRTRV